VAHRSEPRFLVLHGLRLKGSAATDALAKGAGLDPQATETHLRALVEAGWARHHEGRAVPWSLTPAGRTEHRRLAAEELDVSGARPVVEDAYARFQAVNKEFLQLFTDWQVRSESPLELNDHSDEAYDRAVVDRLSAAHASAWPITDDLGAHLERFAGYTSRLGAALDELRAGDLDWFTGPLVDSYHTVWFELHEDLMATLGLERAVEEART
jgi:DNA-binding MarR family transcriptional regulator